MEFSDRRLLVGAPGVAVVVEIAPHQAIRDGLVKKRAGAALMLWVAPGGSCPLRCKPCLDLCCNRSGVSHRSVALRIIIRIAFLVFAGVLMRSSKTFDLASGNEEGGELTQHQSRRLTAR